MGFIFYWNAFCFVFCEVRMRWFSVVGVLVLVGGAMRGAAAAGREEREKAAAASLSMSVVHNPLERCEVCNRDEWDAFMEGKKDLWCCLFFDRCCQNKPASPNSKESSCMECLSYGLSSQKCCFVFGACCLPVHGADLNGTMVTTTTAASSALLLHKPSPKKKKKKKKMFEKRRAATPVYEVVDCRSCQAEGAVEDVCCSGIGVCCEQKVVTSAPPGGKTHPPGKRQLEVECGVCNKFHLPDSDCCRARGTCCGPSTKPPPPPQESRDPLSAILGKKKPHRGFTGISNYFNDIPH